MDVDQGGLKLSTLSHFLFDGFAFLVSFRRLQVDSVFILSRDIFFVDTGHTVTEGSKQRLCRAIRPLLGALLSD